MQIADGDHSARVDEAPRTTRRVAQAFNIMATRTQARLDAQQELLRAVSHELRTPISRLQMAIDLLLRSKEQDQSRHAEGIQQDLAELDGLIEELLRFVRATDPHATRHSVEVAPLVRQVLDREAPHAEPSLAPVIAWVVPEPFRWAVRNVIRNARIHGGERIRVTLTEGELTVDDDGPGIPAESRDHVLEPFTQLDAARSGTGLGLAIAHRVMRHHGGQIRIEASPWGGARVRLQWAAVIPG